MTNYSTKDFDLTNEDASDGSLISLACMFDDGHFISETKKDMSIFIDDVMEYIKEKN